MANFIKLNYYEGDEIYVNLDNIAHFVPSERRIYMITTQREVIQVLGGFEKYQDTMEINLDDASSDKLQKYLNKVRLNN